MKGFKLSKSRPQGSELDLMLSEEDIRNQENVGSNRPFSVYTLDCDINDSGILGGLSDEQSDTE